MMRVRQFFLVLALLGFFCSLPPANSGYAAEPQKNNAPTARKTKTSPNWPPYIRFLSGPVGGQWFQMGEVIARLLNDTVVPTTSRTGGGLANISNIHDKNGDIGFTVSSFLVSARNKVPEFSEVKVDNVALIADVYPQILYFLVRKEFADEHNIASIGDMLESKANVRLASLRPGSASQFVISLLFKYGYNTSFEALRDKGWKVIYSSYAEISDGFVSGQIDCFAYTAGVDVPLIRTIEGYIPIGILNVDAEVLSTFTKKFGMYTRLIPDSQYSSLKKPVQTLGDFSCLIIRRDLPEDMAYEVTKFLYVNKDVIGAKVADFADLDANTAVTHKDLLHPGAARFWKEKLGE